MFTGLVQSVGVVRAVEPAGVGASILVDAGVWAHRPAPGDSISVSGCCLTVAAGSDLERGLLRFDAVSETLAKTTLGALRAGDRVNLEHSLRPETLLGGHLVQGHVDGVGVVEEVRDRASDWRLTVRPPEELMDYLAPKGSIAIDGVSLTIAALGADTLEIALIPTTLELTTLGALRAGARVNVEADMLGKHVVHALRRAGALPARGQA